MKLRVKAPGDPVATDRWRQAMRDLVGEHGGEDVTGRHLRAHVTAMFEDRAAAKAHRLEARAARAAS